MPTARREVLKGRLAKKYLALLFKTENLILSRGFMRGELVGSRYTHFIRGCETGAQGECTKIKHAYAVHVCWETNEMFLCFLFMPVIPSCLGSLFKKTLSGSDSTPCTLQSIMVVSDALYGNSCSRICIMLRESSPLPLLPNHISMLNRC